MSVIFISGIDTDVGKTYATGLLAKYLLKSGKSVITQKLAQTGCNLKSDDIIEHRKIMGIDFDKFGFDADGTTCPYIFKFPASPHLAARLDNKLIDTNVISKATETLNANFEYVIVEGVGGLYVPLNDKLSLIDYLEQKKYPTILVSSSKLGSINHTLLSLEIAYRRNIEILGIIYNNYPTQNPEIFEDSKDIFRKYMIKFNYNPVIIDMPHINNNINNNIDDKIDYDIDFSDLLKFQ